MHGVKFAFLQLRLFQTPHSIAILHPCTPIEELCLVTTSFTKLQASVADLEIFKGGFDFGAENNKKISTIYRGTFSTSALNNLDLLTVKHLPPSAH